MNRTLQILILLVSALMASPALRAEGNTACGCGADSVTMLRPVLAAYTVEAGSAHLTDTYLTPLRYTGWHSALGYERWQAMRFAPERWSMSLRGSLALDRTENPARNATMWGLLLRLDWSMYRRWRPIEQLTLGIGGSVGLEAGVLYNARNGNNPASAKGAVTLGLTGFAAWRTKVGRLPVTLTYRPNLPLTGIFFTPEYGELYYEIYLGDRNGLVHGAWPGNYLDFDHRLTADLHFGSTSLRVGYAGRIFSSKANHIVTNIFTHAFVIGVSGEWMSVNTRRGLPHKSKLIPATY